MSSQSLLLLVAVLLLLGLALLAIRTFFEYVDWYERLVVYRKLPAGEPVHRPTDEPDIRPYVREEDFVRIHGPGWHLVGPKQRSWRVLIRPQTVVCEPPTCFSADDVRVAPVARCQYCVPDTVGAIRMAIERTGDYQRSALKAVESSFRLAFREHELATLLGDMTAVNDQIRDTARLRAASFGVEIRSVYVTDVRLDDWIIRSLAAEAHIGLVGRARLAAATADRQAANELGDLPAERERTLRLYSLDALLDAGDDRVDVNISGDAVVGTDLPPPSQPVKVRKIG